MNKILMHSSCRLWSALIVVLLVSGCGLTGGGSRGDQVDGERAILPKRLDGDLDRVRNKNDKCPDTAANVLVDDTGCAALAGVIEGLKFSAGDHRLSKTSRVALAELAAELENYPSAIIEIAGHTDNRGSAASNLDLSKQRVMSVVRFLVTNGVSAERLKPFGYGESRPRAKNVTAAGRELNRRIEISVLRY